MPILSYRRCSTREFRCLHNTNRFTGPEIRDLLANGAEKLFVRAEQIAETSNAVSFRLTIAGRDYFGKKLKPGSWRRLWWERLSRPTCYGNFLAAGRLISASLPTPSPILAAVLKSSASRQQILVTDWLEDAVELDRFVEQRAKTLRSTVIPELADLLSEFHARGFYSRHLRSANILVQERDGKRAYSFIDLDRLVQCRWLRPANYISTVSRACADLYPGVPPADRRCLLMNCFDYALKRNIFSRPSEQEPFIDSVLAQIRQRNSEVS